MVNRILRNASFCMLISFGIFAQNVQIKWDSWGVPHIQGSSDAELFYGFGWAQMEAHTDLILKGYGQARGRSAEYWGGNSNIESDLLIRRLNFPGRAQDWYRLQDAEMKELLDSFTDGMNAYCLENPDKISQDLKSVLPVRPTDPLAKLFMSYHLKVGGFALQPQAEEWKNAGSNAWALSPLKSKNNTTLMLIQPHPPWMDDYLFFEAHLQNDKFNVYGVSMPGIPLIAMGFNDNLGWGLTFNQADAMDLIELTPSDQDLEIYADTLRILGEESKLIEVKKSLFGYVVAEKQGKDLALRLSGLDRPHFVRQFYDMAQAGSLTDFESAMRSLQLPLQNVIYGDREGHIYYLYNGLIPERSGGHLTDWAGVLSSLSPDALVKQYVNFEQLPQIKDPASGFVANSNNDPWSSTFPAVKLPSNTPGYLAPKPFESFDSRARSSLKMILSKPLLDLDDLEDMQGSTHAELADRSLDQLVEFAAGSSDSILVRAGEILAAWDKTAEGNSRGGPLFMNWYLASRKGNRFKDELDQSDPLNTPKRLSKSAMEALRMAAESTIKKYNRLDVSWQEVYKTNYAGRNLDGGLGLNELGSFNAGFYNRISPQTFNLQGGSAYTLILEFSTPLRARGLLSYGNSSQENSAHRGDQLDLMLKRKLRPVFFTKDEINQNLERTEELRIAK